MCGGIVQVVSAVKLTAKDLEDIYGKPNQKTKKKKKSKAKVKNNIFAKMFNIK